MSDANPWFSETLTLVGTNHTAAESKHAITTAFADADPDVVAVELDHGRLTSLRSKPRQPPTWQVARRHGIAAYIFTKLTYAAQRVITGETGILPGEEMLHAVDLAAEHSKPVHLIDRPLEDTLDAINDAVGFSTAWRALVDIVKAPFQDAPSFDPTTIPDEEAIQRVLSHVKQRYPSIYEALIQSRDIHMAAELHDLLLRHDSVLAVVGAAHTVGIRRQLHAMEAPSV